jgi:SAM-dependent methyltransferase
VYRLAGARVVYLTDSTKLLCDQSLDAALGFLAGSSKEICAALQVSQNHFDNVLTEASEGRGTMQDRLNSLEILYLAPCDCRSLALESGSLDIIFSRAVLEHIPKPVIHEIFRESKRLLRPGGVMCHFIDNSDHWEHRDKSISRINFLQHGDLLWRWTCINGLNYQNRLRHQGYLNILREEGFEIVQAEGEIDQKSLQILPKLRLAAQFRGKPFEDLAVISSYLLASAPK